MSGSRWCCGTIVAGSLSKAVVTCVQYLIEVPREDEEQRPLYGHDSHRNRGAVEAIVQVVEAEPLASLPKRTSSLSVRQDICPWHPQASTLRR